ncbi:MAG: hypothetical protein IPK35_22955 [Saprospiraceae bacterium]|nr:hypothetical protein [Saprospiraceae bacterium]
MKVGFGLLEKSLTRKEMRIILGGSGSSEGSGCPHWSCQTIRCPCNVSSPNPKDLCCTGLSCRHVSVGIGACE